MTKYNLRNTTYPLLLLLMSFVFCHTQNKRENVKDSVTEQSTVPKEATNINLFKQNATTEIGGNILCILQDKNFNYWFGTQNLGVYRYDGKTLTQFTEKDGLFNNQVQSIQEDKSGNIWFGTGGFGVSRYDGRAFTTFSNKENLRLSINSDKEWKIEQNDLWFNAGGGVYHYNGSTLTYLPLPKTDFDTKYSKGSPNRLSAYGVYCILKDGKGNLWFGTQNMGVCRFDGKYFTWLTDKGLRGPAVLGLFEDKNGNLWFGNNGYGLFQYDGKSLTNFTKEKGLSNDDFLKTLKVSDKPVQNNLTRIYSINEDNNGNLWIGTIDSGVWRYDGTNLTNYTTSDGLTSNAVNVIYKDKKGELWFGTDGVGVCKFNGRFFTKFAVK